MRKLFTFYGRAMATFSYECPRQGHVVVAKNTYSLPQRVLNPFYKDDFKPETNFESNSFNFFIYFATYHQVNPLLITYSAETTHTYRQTFTSSLKFSHPADVLPSVFLGNIPKSIITDNISDR